MRTDDSFINQTLLGSGGRKMIAKSSVSQSVIYGYFLRNPFCVYMFIWIIFIMKL